MNPHQFKSEYLDTLPEVDPELDLGLDEFVIYSEASLEGFDLSEHDAIWLSSVGLPAASAPFLNFSSGHGYLPGVFPAGFCYLGSTGWGDPIALQDSTGAIVRLDHERGFEAFPLSSSLTQFAKSLCVVQRCVTQNDFSNCERTLKSIDTKVDISFWMDGEDDYS